MLELLGIGGIVGIAIVVSLVFLVMLVASRYKTVSPDEAMIITGAALGSKNVLTDESARKVKIVRGGGAFIVPIVQQREHMSLLSHKLDVMTPEVYTAEGVPVMTDGVAVIKVGSSVEDVATAAEQFLGKPDEELRAEAREVLEGHLRAILGTLTVEEVYRNRDKFAQEVQSVAARDLKKMGLQIVSFTIKDVRDKNGYLEALGRPRIAAIKRDADIAEAEATRDARIKKANADEEGQKAELVRDTNVAEANKEKELKVAAFKKEQDTAKAAADLAYSVQEATSQRVVVEEQMQVELVRKQREVDLEKLEIERREKQYDSEVKKKADADRYAVEQAAEADKLRQMRRAEARQFEIEAEAKAKAEAKRLDGQAVGDATRAEGLAEAEVVLQRGLAEAEAKEKLAEAFARYGEAAVLDLLATMMPALAREVAAPLASIQKLTVVDTGGGQGVGRVTDSVANLMATTPELIKSLTGVDLLALAQQFGETKPVPAASGDGAPPTLLEPPTEADEL
ncbi:flotillin [Rubrivirga sp. SAORIC476]|uniref:flotillin family protein n=1 Tax=Rubrivirga sp. SAORIC476 TaxID=1961794 RepID=UPI000BA939B0|nr:flotillin family protein [Rubrivirga sp. SAORIC476]MAQ95372.1 flotillin [Rhodothermaceae bacterium]MBC13447.1 flotillin [Rhodothermaceae bacterium]PAP74765.1 flotillin [Rubrivirga sp. SAORIC476]